MGNITEILLNGGIGAIGFIGGRIWEKRDQRENIINDKIEKTSNDIRKLSTMAVKFYIHEMDERTTSAETALIGSEFKRLNIELHSLCLAGKLEPNVFLGVLNNFHAAITAEPFGARQIQPVDANDKRIALIQRCEEDFLRKLKSHEKL